MRVIVIVRVRGQLFDYVNKIEYFGSIVQDNGRTAEDVASKIGHGSMKRHKTIGVLCDKKIPSKVFIKLLRGQQ